MAKVVSLEDISEEDAEQQQVFAPSVSLEYHLLCVLINIVFHLQRRGGRQREREEEEEEEEQSQ